MLVKNWMTRSVITLDVSDTLKKAKDLLVENRIRSLPVLENGRLVGIVSDRDLKKASISDESGLNEHELLYLNNRIPIVEIMTPAPLTVSPETTVDEVAEVMYTRKISGLPVVDDQGNLAGMITQGDIFRLMISLTGIKQKGVQVAVQLSDEPGSIRVVADLIRSFNGRIVSVLTSYDHVPEGKRNVYYRASNLDEARIEELKLAIAAEATLLYVVFHSK